MKDILQCLEAILRNGYSSFTIFNDWLDIMLYALQRDDPHYLDIVHRYKNTQPQGSREIDYFCKAFALLQIEMQRTNDDILGQLYMQWNINNKCRSQFFTPPHVAHMMASMLNPKGNISDPCCGSGIMLIEALKSMSEEDIKSSTFFGQDIDLTCVKMCALNLLFLNVHGFIIWGDNLMLECKKVYRTIRTVYGGLIEELIGEDLEKFRTWYCVSMEKKSETMAEENTTQSQQLTLF